MLLLFEPEDAWSVGEVQAAFTSHAVNQGDSVCEERERERERESKAAEAILAQVGTHPRLEPNEQRSGAERHPQLGLRLVGRDVVRLPLASLTPWKRTKRDGVTTENWVSESPWRIWSQDTSRARRGNLTRVGKKGGRLAVVLSGGRRHVLGGVSCTGAPRAPRSIQSPANAGVRGVLGGWVSNPQDKVAAQPPRSLECELRVGLQAEAEA